MTQHEEKCAEGFVCLFGFVSGVLAIVLISLRGGLHVWRSPCEAAGDSCRGRETGRPVGPRRRVGRRLELLGDTVGAGGIGRSLSCVSREFWLERL